jgi:pimeloyl-ACP methyl ester carboxylesterase
MNARRRAADLLDSVQTLGRGPRVVLVHGSVMPGLMSWQEQRELAERWTLIVPDRFAGDRTVDFDVDADGVADLLDGGAHLVGHSYGGVVSLLAAARRPQAVHSLTVVEPPAFDAARGDPAVDRLVAELRAHWAEGPEDPEAFLLGFIRIMGSDVPLPSPLAPALERGARAFRRERSPWDATIPLEALARAPFPKLVVSGGWHPALEAVCDAIAGGIGARREAISGADHSVQAVAAPFNRLLDRFLSDATEAG